MADGCRLAARVWLPEGAGETPVPAILEYLPYRKSDFTAVRDSIIHRYFAAHGYACVRVDLRGSGDSGGILQDEYLPREQEDGVEVLRWIAAQPWCTGDVGMIGLSWGGFNALQIAALAPPELKAVVSVCSSDDRYTDDVHYMGGCLLTDNLSWASTMFAYNACPPDPLIVGERWKAIWLERLAGSGLWLTTWLAHQHRDRYWRHASVCEDFSAIRCPVYAVSGWADGYSNTVFRLLENLTVPRLGLIGAWGHKYPHESALGTPIGFLSECLRWWDRWLKGIETGIDREPMLRVWMQDSISPLSVSRPGWWIAEPGWPSANVEQVTYPLNPREIALDGRAQPERKLDVRSPLSVGLFAGKWCSYNSETDLPSDQREEDGGALVFDSPQLSAPLEVLGAPQVELELSSDREVAMIAVRLSDVAPDGKATRVTYGLLNLTHRGGHEAPSPLEPGTRYRVRVSLNHVAQHFRTGHRLRLSISSSYWPLAWPPPAPVNLSVFSGVSTLSLPLRPTRSEDRDLLPFSDPAGGEPISTTLIEPERREWQVIHNLRTNESTLHVIDNAGRYRIDATDLEVERRSSERYSYRNYDYATVRAEVRASRSFRRPGWSTRSETRTLMTSTPTHFIVTASLDAYAGDARIFSKSWDERIARKLV